MPTAAELPAPAGSAVIDFPAEAAAWIRANAWTETMRRSPWPMPDGSRGTYDAAEALAQCDCQVGQCSHCKTDRHEFCHAKRPDLAPGMSQPEWWLANLPVRIAGYPCRSLCPCPCPPSAAQAEGEIGGGVLPGLEHLCPAHPPQAPVRRRSSRRKRPEPIPELFWSGLAALPGMEHLGPAPRAPQRLQRRRVAGWKAPRGAVIVDRTTAYGNPWRIAGDDRRGWRVFRLVDGDETGLTLCTSEAEARALAVDRYRAYLTGERPDLIERARTELAGCDLLCPCRPGAACHADVLLDAAAGRPITPDDERTSRHDNASRTPGPGSRATRPR